MSKLKDLKLPFQQRLAWSMLLPALVVGFAFSILSNYLLAPSLISLLENRMQADLKLASDMAMRICEERFNDLLEMRLEKDPDMIATARRESVSEIKSIRKKFHEVHMLIIEDNRTLLGSSLDVPPGKLPLPLPKKATGNITDQSIGGEPAKMYYQYFPLWKWHIVSFTYDQDFLAPILLVRRILYVGTFSIMTVLVLTVFLVFRWRVNKPLNQIIMATRALAHGEFKTIEVTRRDEVAQVALAFNSMVGSLQQELLERLKAEDALRDSEQKYRLLVTDVPAMVYRGYADWSVDFFDDKIEELTGYTLEDFTTRRVKWSDLMLSEDLEGAEEIFKQALKGDKSFVREYRIRTRWDTVQWVRDRGKIICSQDGRINHVTGVFSNITNQKAVEEALKNERDFTAALLNTVGALVMVLDREGRIVRFNYACELATGFLFDMVKGKHYWDLLLPAAEIESATTHFQQLQAGNFPSCYEGYWVSLDGNQRLINWTNTCLVGEDGTVQYIISTGIDITRRRQTEAALERLRLQNELILSSAGQGIFGLDMEGNTTFINPAALEMTGYESGEMLGQNIREIIHYRKADGTPSPAEECPIYRTLTYGEVQRVVDDLFWTKEGQPLPVEYVTTPIRENGVLVGAVGVFRDITERKAWEEELQKANEQLKMLVAGVEERNRQMTLLNEMGDVLQACQSSEEAYQVIRNFMPKFFPTLAGGALYMLNHAQNLFQEVGVWGKSLLLEKVFAPDECWALRRGRLHLVDDPGAEMSCRHVSQPLQAGYLCVPLMAQSKAMGILYVQATGLIPSDLKEPTAQIAATLGEGMALALANLKLRETLRSQAIRDSLTGLFNRRYLEETLERELHRVKRLGIHLGVVMIDLDHFKQYNDNFGHNAGDELLVALGNLILSLVRAEDIPCRFGGEEFLLIIPGGSLEVTLERAEQLRLSVKQLHEQHPGKFLHPVTISAGVAVFPRYGASADVLIRAADAALYQAKREGRDRVVVADVDSA